MLTDTPPCPRCGGVMHIDPDYQHLLAVCEQCAFFTRLPGPYTPDRSHTAKLIGS